MCHSYRCIGLQHLKTESYHFQVFKPDEEYDVTDTQTSSKSPFLDDDKDDSFERNTIKECVELLKKQHKIEITRRELTGIRYADGFPAGKTICISNSTQKLTVDLKERLSLNDHVMRCSSGEEKSELNEPNCFYLMNKSCLVFVEETTDPILKTATLMFYCYVFRESILKTATYVMEGYSEKLVDFKLCSYQLFVTSKSPATILWINFFNPSPRQPATTPTVMKWQSEHMASRFLVCKNFVAIINNQVHPECFHCVTFLNKTMYEQMIHKSSVFLDDDVSFELPCLINHNGKILWLAQQDNILKILHIVDKNNQSNVFKTSKHDGTLNVPSCLEVLKTFDLNFTESSKDTKNYKFQVKNIYFDSEFVYVPSFSTDAINCCVANAIEVALIDLTFLTLTHNLKASCSLDLYTDEVTIDRVQYKQQIHVNVTRKLPGKKNCVLKRLVFSVPARSLKEYARNVYVNSFPALMSSGKDFSVLKHLVR